MRALLVACLCCVALSAAWSQPELTADERAYLAELASDTWQSIAYMGDGEAALPVDKTTMPDYTSVSNIGFYLACVPAAEALGLIDHAEAVGRVTRVIEACEELDTWEGFAHSWLQAKSLGPTDERIVSSVDLGNYEAGMMVCRQAYPELRERISKLIDAMNWRALYCPENGWLYGGWNTRDEAYTNWYYLFLGGDSRTCSFLAVAHGVALEHWQRLVRSLDEPAGPARYNPGWDGGGLFMQTMTALFIDEAGTPIGRSAANFAWAQNLRGRENKLPAWGWSACVTPDGQGYIGYGQFREEVVTPHAAALAAMYFPHEAIESLRALEDLGAREPILVDGEERRWGFRDCIDIHTAQTPNLMLILDQGMLFLACANLLEDDCVRGWFQADPICKRGQAIIEDYQISDEARAAFWRDVEALRQGRIAELALD